MYMAIQQKAHGIDWHQVLIQGEKTGLVVLCALAGTAVVFSPFLIARWLGSIEDQDIFFKTVDEGQARAVMINGKFDKMIMSFNGHRFSGKALPNDPASKWDVIPGETWGTKILKVIPIFGKLVGGLHWIGMWPFAEINRYHFKWITWDYPDQGSGDNSKKSEKTAVPRSELIGHILVQDYVYYLKIKQAETLALPIAPSPQNPGAPKIEAGVPADLELLFTIRITNPYKARFAAQDWLELVTNQMEVYVREIVGTFEFTDLFANANARSEELQVRLAAQIAEIKQTYGVWIKKIQIQSVQPGGPEAEKYRALTTKVYEANQNAKAREIEAGAERKYLMETVGYVASDPAVLEAYKWRQIKESGLSTYIESGSGVGVNINASPGGSSSRSPATQNPTPTPKP